MGNDREILFIEKKHFYFYLISSFIIGILLFGLFSCIILPNSQNIPINEKDYGYIEFPSAYNNMNNIMTNITINSGTIENLTNDDNQFVNMTIDSMGIVEFGWQLIYIADSYTDFVNMTLNITIYSNQSLNITIEVFHLIAGLVPDQGKWDNWLNLTLQEGKNTFSNLTLVGEDGYYENITEAFGNGGLLCNRNGILEIRFIFPTDFVSNQDYEICLDKISMIFYVNKFASYLN